MWPPLPEIRRRQPLPASGAVDLVASESGAVCGVPAHDGGIAKRTRFGLRGTSEADCTGLAAATDGISSSESGNAMDLALRPDYSCSNLKEYLTDMVSAQYDERLLQIRLRENSAVQT